jgi:hypothetical protein
MSTSLSKKPKFDHPIVTLVVVAITCSVLAAFGTRAFLSSRSSTDTCAAVVGSLRIEMGRSKVPSVFDEKAWDELTTQYNQVFENCDAATANDFATKEFNPWAAPALEVLRPTASTETGSSSSGASTAPASSVPTSTEVPATTTGG